MNTYIALLRGINVGGHTPLPMAELRGICSGLGFENVRTYIQSGNIVFESSDDEQTLTRVLEQALQAHSAKHIPVIIRTAGEMQTVIDHNPFPDAIPAQLGVMFFAKPLPKDLLQGFSNPGSEEIVQASRELYIHFPKGMGRSKLKLPKMAVQGTVRNINTVTRLNEICGK